MNNLRYKYLAADIGIAAIFAENFPEIYDNFFDGISANNLDFYIKYVYGNRIVVETVTAENFSEIVVNIIQINLDKWTKLYNIALSNLNVLGNVETRTKSGTLTRETENENETTTAAKVFNDTDFNTDNKDTATASGTATDTYNLTETVSRETDITDRKRNAVNFENNFAFKKAVIADIINEITLRIY